jgi:hypothetical protein
VIRIAVAGAIILVIGTSSAVAGIMLSRAALARTATLTGGLPAAEGQKLLPVPGALRGSVR